MACSVDQDTTTKAKKEIVTLISGYKMYIVLTKIQTYILV